MGQDGSVLTDDEARFKRFDQALGSIVGNHGEHSPHSDAVRSDALALSQMSSEFGMGLMRVEAVYNAAIQHNNFLAGRIAKSYPSIKNMVALVEALRLQVVIERME